MPLHGARARLCRPEGEAEGEGRGLACKGQAQAVSLAAVIQLTTILLPYY